MISSKLLTRKRKLVFSKDKYHTQLIAVNIVKGSKWSGIFKDGEITVIIQNRSW